MKYIILGTAGHIDHGKSSLVKALTGIDPDRLKEEKERGITLDALLGKKRHQSQQKLMRIIAYHICRLLLQCYHS